MTNQQVTTRPWPQSPIVVMAEKYQIEPEKLMGILRNTVIKATDKHTPTNEEVAAFIIVSNQYGLSPFIRQIHAFYSERAGIVPIVGIDGWAAIVNRREDFDGCEFEEITAEDGTPQCTICRMYVKGRSHPVAAPEWFTECVRNTIPWKTMPRRMLRHKAYIQAARICFGLSGIYDEDEGSDILRNARAVLESAGEVSKPPEGRQRLPRNPRKPPASQPTEEKPPHSAEETPVRQPGEDDDELIPPGAIVDEAPPAETSEPTSTQSQWFNALIAAHDDRIDSMFNPAELEGILEAIHKDAEQLGHAEFYRLTVKARDRARKMFTRQNAGEKK